MVEMKSLLGFLGIEKADKKVELYCHNPRCRSIILNQSVAYSPELKGVYHSYSCAAVAASEEASLIKEGVLMDLQYIKLETALKLQKNGKLKSIEDIKQAV